jgi:outer membrane receptor protein involved in Fe transport
MYNVHTVKAGFEIQRHTMRYYRALFPTEAYNGLDGGGFIDVDRYGYDFEANESDDQGWENETKHPVNWAGFLQDRFEWSGMIVSAGLRFDYYDYKTLRLRNPELPLDPDSLQFKTPATPGNFTSLDPEDLAESENYTRVSPRLGISFPISDKTQMHMNYGKFFQRPDLIRLYVGYDYYEKMVNLGGYSYQFGNPNLEPEKTTQYEIGLTRQLGDNAVMKLSAFYKDVTGLVQVYNQSSLPKSFESYRNSDYSSIKGIETQLVMRRTNNIQMDIKYSLSFANGTGSYANTQSNVSWTNANLPKQTAPLSFDQRHNIVGVFDFRTRKGEGPKWGNFFLFENFGANVVLQAGSGTPYSPQKVFNEVTLAAVSPIPDGPRNSEYSPWTLNIDMKIERTFDVRAYKLSAYVWVKNLLDRNNVYSVYEGTGSADNTGWLETPAGITWLQGADATTADATGYTGADKYEFKENNPQNYGNPRQILAGLRFSF